MMNRPLRPLLPLIAVLACPVAAFTSSAWAQAGEAKVQAVWVFDADAVHPGGIIHAALQVSLQDKFHVQSNKPLDENQIPTTLTVAPPAGITVREVVFPQSITFDVAGDPTAVFPQEFAIGVALNLAADAKPGVHPVTAELNYQACNDKICLPPDTLTLKFNLKVVAADVAIAAAANPVFEQIKFSAQPTPPAPPTIPQARPALPPPANDQGCDVMAELNGFTVLGTAGGYLGADKFLQFIDDAEKGIVKRNIFEDMGPIAIVLAIIVGGILLNLTPCVLPLIPINLAIIGAGVKAGSRARGFALGGAYGLAMAIVYGALGLIVTLTAASFGTINSTVWFNVAIAILFVFLALAMFDVIAIDFTKYQSKLDATGLGKHGAFAMAFGMGGVTALLAGACVAPIVISVIVYSSDQYAKGSTLALALPFCLGLGMALPWPFAGAGLSCLPKPGMWMVWVKKAMGVFILLFAAYYGYLAWEIWDSKRVDPAAVRSAVQASVEGGWTPSICAGLAQAKAENKPVIIDMWATWCKNCLWMDKTTFKDERVLKRLDGYVKIKYQAEDLRSAPAKDVLKHFKGVGLPQYAILRPNNAAAAKK